MQNELRELRGQMGLARGLKDGSQPEYEEKLERLRQLRTLKDNYIARMQSIREDLKGLDCKSEAELDAKIKEMENKISHEGVALREEKQIVQNIAKLQKQREQVGGVHCMMQYCIYRDKQSLLHAFFIGIEACTGP